MTKSEGVDSRSRSRRRAWRTWLTCAAICAATIGCGNEGGSTPGAVSSFGPHLEAQVDPPKPDKELVFQPQLNFADGSVTHQGTAFLARAPNGETAAVTAAHFLDPSGPALVHVWLLSVPATEPTALAESTVSWGKPGDRQTDRFLLPVTVNEEFVHVLELDDRPAPENRERVWLPDKQPGEPGGFHLVEATVIQVDASLIYVQLDQPIKLQSQSGSPLISQLNGTVIGLLAGGHEDRGTIILHLYPAREIRKGFYDPSRPDLSTVVGTAKPGAAR